MSPAQSVGWLVCRIMQKVWDGFQQNLVEDKEWASKIWGRIWGEKCRSRNFDLWYRGYLWDGVLQLNLLELLGFG